MKIKQGRQWLPTKWGYPDLSTDSGDQMLSDMQSILAVSVYGSSILSSSSGPYLSGLKLRSNLGNWICIGKCDIQMGTVSPGGALYYISAGFDSFITYTRPSVLTFAFNCSQ